MNIPEEQAFDAERLIRTQRARDAGWTHPTGSWPRRVTLLCLGPSVHDYITEIFMPNLPDSVYGRDEVWTLNRGALVFRHDVAFVMDYLSGEEKRYPRYAEYLRDLHPEPIITSDSFEGWPEHVHAYPLHEILKYFSPHHTRFRNSIPYILAYASWIGVLEISVWGADYTHPLSMRRENDRPNAEYWVGVVRERGMTVLIPNKSTLCDSNCENTFYGYRDPYEACQK